MKIVKKQLRSLALLVLFQSCRVYRRDSAAIDQSWNLNIGDGFNAPV